MRTGKSRLPGVLFPISLQTKTRMEQCIC
jgi:hypothetical protein